MQHRFNMKRDKVRLTELYLVPWPTKQPGLDGLFALGWTLAHPGCEKQGPVISPGIHPAYIPFSGLILRKNGRAT